MKGLKRKREDECLVLNMKNKIFKFIEYNDYKSQNLFRKKGIYNFKYFNFIYLEGKQVNLGIKNFNIVYKLKVKENIL